MFNKVPSFVSLLARLAKIEAQVQELVGRVHPIQKAIVTEVKVDQRQRLIRCTRESQAGQSQTFYLPAGRSTCFTDEPLPKAGTTVAIAFIEGNPHDPVLFRTYPNDTNPPDANQQNPADDHTTEIPGSERHLVGGNRYHKVNGAESRETENDLTITCNGDLLMIDAPNGNIEISALSGEVVVKGFVRVRFEDGSGAYSQMQNGQWTFADAGGQKWTMGGGRSTFDLGGGTFDIVNAGDATINGQSILVVGSTDTDEDTNITRGY
jgi:hypothetical protein